MYLNLPVLDLGLESLQNTKVPVIQFSLAALRLASVVGFSEFFSCLVLSWVNQMHLSWFEDVENTPGEVGFVNSKFRTHGIGRAACSTEARASVEAFFAESLWSHDEGSRRPIPPRF